MKTRHITILTMCAAALASCAPYPSSNPNPNRGGGTGTPSQPTGPEVPAPQVDAHRNVPTGHPDPQGRPHMVVSPYRPYNVIDIKGYRSGDIVGDPSTAKVNPSTGKLDMKTSKHFRIP